MLNNLVNLEFKLNQLVKPVNNYRIRIQYGGDNTEMSLIQIRDVVTTTMSEYCGYMHDNRYICNHIGPPKTEGSRGSCNQLNAPSIWHTHSSVSKYYPSIEDINKILKYQEIHISKIFTQYGDWTMEYKGKSVNIISHDDILNTTIFTPFYHDTQMGRSYNESATYKLVQSLNAYLRNIGIVDFIIMWTPLQ